MKKQISTIGYDENTGEVFYNLTEIKENNLWKDGKGAITKNNNAHNKLYNKTKLSDIIKDKRDLLSTYLCMENIFSNTNIIYKRVGNVYYRPASIEDISEIIGLDLKRTKTYLNKMVNQGIIAKSTIEIKNEKIISYIFNPVYINSCRFINASIYFLFKPYLDKYFPEWIQKQYDILINSKTEINNFESLSNKSITRDKLWKENVGAIFRPQEKHRKIYHDLIISDVIDSKKDVLNIYILYEYIQGNNNAIYFGNHPATVEEISLLLGINERSTKRFLNKISSAGIVRKLAYLEKNKSVTEYCFNPIYINSEKYVGLELYYLFKDYLDDILPRWIILKYENWKKEICR